MAAPSTYQDPETKRISFFVNNRTWKILTKMAEKRNMETWKFIKEHVEHVALDHKDLIVPRMPAEHYTARHNDDVGDC